MNGTIRAAAAVVVAAAVTGLGWPVLAAHTHAGSRPVAPLVAPLVAPAPPAPAVMTTLPTATPAPAPTADAGTSDAPDTSDAPVTSAPSAVTAHIRGRAVRCAIDPGLGPDNYLCPDPPTSKG